jgi:hypothetical protein
MTIEEAETAIRAAFPDRPLLEVAIDYHLPRGEWHFYVGKATRMKRFYRSKRSLEEATKAVIAKLKAE